METRFILRSAKFCLRKIVSFEVRFYGGLGIRIVREAGSLTSSASFRDINRLPVSYYMPPLSSDFRTR